MQKFWILFSRLPRMKKFFVVKKKICTSDQTQFWEDLRQVSKQKGKVFFFATTTDQK